MYKAKSGKILIDNNKNRLLNYKGNNIDYDVDQESYFYLTFMFKNRIEKYSSEGKLLWKADRVLNCSTKPIDKGNPKPRGFVSPKMNSVSSGIAVDEKGRVWVATFNRQLREDEKSVVLYGGAGTQKTISRGEIKRMDIYKLEIFDPEGVLLGEIQLDHHAGSIRIHKNYLFISDARNAKYCQYKIVEK